MDVYQITLGHRLWWNGYKKEFQDIRRIREPRTIRCFYWIILMLSQSVIIVQECMFNDNIAQNPSIRMIIPDILPNPGNA